MAKSPEEVARKIKLLIEGGESLDNLGRLLPDLRNLCDETSTAFLFRRPKRPKYRHTDKPWSVVWKRELF